jgi:MATE family multidrug resistance protein
LLTAGTWQAAVGFVYLLAPAPIMGLFAPEEHSTDLPELVSVGAVLLAISAAWQLFDSIGMAVGETLRAAGDTAFALFARLTVAWVLFVPGSYAAVRNFEAGAPAAMVAVVAYLAVLSAVLVLRFRAGTWRRIQLTEEHLPDEVPA